MVELEVFVGDPPCPVCVAFIDLAERVAAKHKDELEPTVQAGSDAMEKLEAYELFRAAAAVAPRACAPEKRH